MGISLKRVYEKESENDGYRILIDGLWPRGIGKKHAHIDEWAKDLAPSNDLRTWFHHDPDKWYKFKIMYLNELQTNANVIPQIREILKKAKNGKVTLIYAARDEKYNNAVVLKEFLEKNK